VRLLRIAASCLHVVAGIVFAQALLTPPRESLMMSYIALGASHQSA